MKQTSERISAEYDSRLAEVAADWFRQARELDVCLQYEFTGLTESVGREDELKAVDALVTQVLRAIGGRERDERWLSLTVDRQPDRFHLKCVSSWPCPAVLDPLVELGAETSLHQDSRGCDFTVDWRRRSGPEEKAPC